MAKQASVRSFFSASSSSGSTSNTSIVTAENLVADSEPRLESNSEDSDVESSPLHCPAKRKKVEKRK